MDSVTSDVAGQAAAAPCDAEPLMAAIHAALARWGVTSQEEGLEEMRRRWPGFLKLGLGTDITPRLTQLDFFAAQGAMTKAACARLAIGQPKVLSRYSVEVLWEGRDLVAVNKPFDMRIDLPKDTARNWPEERTVADWFLSRYPLQRVRFCHQLDYATSGVMLMATTKSAGRVASQIFEQRRASKTYLCLVLGRVPWPEGKEVPLTNRLADAEDGGFARRVVGAGDPGEEAETRVCVLRSGMWPPDPLSPNKEGVPDSVAASGQIKVAAQYEVALVEARLITGRRHQIRLHLAAAGVPILGDATYGGEPEEGGCYRMFLHAHRLQLPLPGGEVVIEAPCPFEDELLIQ